jgi:septum formation protein
VAVGQIILGKPTDDKSAFQMLQMLSGRTHEVITGVCIRSLNKEVSFSSSTQVKFKNLSENEIRYYIEHYQPFDKAGSYGIQEWIGKIGVEWIEGSFYNVMGLPIQKLYSELCNFTK